MMKERWTINERNFVLAKLCNANTEWSTKYYWWTLSEILKSLNNISAKQLIISGDLTFILTLFSQGRNPSLILLLYFIFCQILELKHILIFAMFGGLKIIRTKNLLFAIIWRALFKVDWTFLFQMLCKSLFTKQVSEIDSTVTAQLFNLLWIWIKKTRGESVYGNLIALFYQIQNLFVK